MYKIVTHCFSALFFLFLVSSGYSQQTNDIRGVTVIGDSGVSMSMGDLQKLSDLAPPRKIKPSQEEEIDRHLQNHPSSPAISKFPDGPALMDLGTTQAMHSNFQAISLSESNAVPPDCMGDLSETQVCIAANGRLKFYAKPTICDQPVITSITAGSNSLINPQFNIDLDVFFNLVRNNSDITDPQVHYDRLTKRWFIVAINVANKSNRMVVAVSNSAEVTASTSFTFFFFTHDQGTVSGGFDFEKFGDFPMMGLDKNALYIGALIFDADNSEYEGSSCYVIKKSSILSSGPIVFTAFRRIGATGSGIFAPNPAFNDDPQSTRGYFVGVSVSNFGILNYVIVNDPGGTPTTTTGTITVPVTSSPINQTAKGSNKPLDAGDDRLLNVQMMKNKVSGINTIWTAQNIAVTAAGLGSASGTNLRNAVRWYELNVTNTALSLKQSGTWYDNSATNPMGFWMGSIAASGQGHALAGASAAGPDKHANVIIAGRYNTQTLGELNQPVFATNFSNTYNRETGDEQRWGDYSQTVVDPSDNMTLWTFQEYTNATNSWGERATQLKAPPPSTPVSLSPIICNTQRISEVILTGQSTNGTGFFDPGEDTGGPGFSKRLQIQSTGNIEVTGITFESPTQIRFLINYAAAPTGSQQTFTITNPDCQSVTFNYNLPTCDGPVITKLLTVYPNPTTGNLSVRLSETGGQLRLLDITGKLVSVQTVASSFLTIPAVLIPPGVYIVEYINGSVSAKEKVLVL
ncbi:MAG: T9SS type A sorting domain-containing protein [Bacteroidota bacterium]